MEKWPKMTFRSLHNALHLARAVVKLCCCAYRSRGQGSKVTRKYNSDS